MLLPYSNELNIGYLSRLFDDTTNCYKFFWFQAILKNMTEHSARFSFEDLINEMIVDAWYMVTEYHLRLGPLGVTDNLEEVVKYIYSNYHINSSEKREKILNFLNSTDDSTIRKYKRNLIKYVPYHLQVPFYDDIKIDKKTWEGSRVTLSNEINRQHRLMYYFVTIAGLSTEIEVDNIWAEYFIKHREILKCWTQLKLIQYLQNKNPNVPGIADKIEPPMSRDIKRVRKYWKLIVSIDPSIRDIYGDVDLSQKIISIDHFVPWQYVAHDELWNLHPTTKSINSSKNNALPEWNVYFDLLGNIEYRAYELRASNEAVMREFNEIAPYHLNNAEIRAQLYADGLDMPEFKKRLSNIIKPVYDSAKMQGFKEWHYSSTIKGT